MTPEQIKANVENEFRDSINHLCSSAIRWEARETIVNLLCTAYASGAMKQTIEALEIVRKK